MRHLTIILCLGFTAPALSFHRASGDETLKLFEGIELYAPGHFGNSYEAMGEYEMRDLLEEARSWGCTSYGDWFDMLDCSDPFRAERQVGLGRALWNAKKANFRSARKADLKTDFLITPNRDSKKVQEWVLKTELFRLHRKIDTTGEMSGGDWTPERLQLVESYWQTREQIHRQLWGLAPQKHIFARKFFPPAWYKSWSKHVGHP